MYFRDEQGYMKEIMFNLTAAVIATLCVTGVSALGYKIAHKANMKANADVQTSYALQDIARDLDRIADDYDRASSQAKPAPTPDDGGDEVTSRKRRKPTQSELSYIDKTPGCAYVAGMGYDNQIPPDYCRQ